MGGVRGCPPVSCDIGEEGPGGILALGRGTAMNQDFKKAAGRCR